MTETSECINKQLESLSPLHLEVVNESMHHGGYFDGKESHFKVTIVSDLFEGDRMVQRHQQVYQLLNNLLIAQGGTVHALALHTYRLSEWQKRANSPDSPQCASKN